MAEVKRLAVALLFIAAVAQANFREFLQIPADPALDAALRHTADATLKAFRS